jgi:hypothetical protein
MAINFPTSPSTNDTFTVGFITYKWDGAKWIGQGVTPETDRLVEGSNKLEINDSNELVWTGGDAKFGGSLEVGANIDLTDSTVDLYSQTTNAASKTFQLFSDIGGTKTEKLSITANGAATLGGVCKVDRTVSGDGCFHAALNGTVKASITSAGSATFLGDVGIGSSASPRTELDLFDGQLSFSHRTDYSIRFYNGTGNNWSAILNPSINDGTNASALSFKVATGEALRIDTAGEVTKPRQPAFIVRYSVNDTTWNVATDGWTKIPFDEENMDRGGNFNTSTSEFTAPVAGTYLFGAELQLEAPNGISSGYLTSGSNWMYITFIVNGSTTLVESEGGTRTDANFNSMYNSYNPTHLLQLAAGDTVCMYRNGNYSTIKFKGGGESVFWGYLVG